ncbi:LacI family DNA-binding transcriptional regulator [Streptomyces pseudogriseolus]|uniref:LacI family transcriptional regulator n=1 Tax=Streptomyces gancidicus BKS 13-15 TaxID=1284664 RepID=M3DEL6_STREZ|nr:LacI family DNA-binding transcriptional regulator [Streptomyces gancidicus]EMF28410.1 LacI family transcriptional regulator [Streptomyces gancidicus BKS 13-15]
MPRARTRPTSRDVAREAGVSQAAVSLVLGDKWRGRVSETTAERVREAARTLGYRPNLAARNLRLGRTRTVLLVVPALTTEFFAGVYTGAARVASRHGFGVVLYPSPEGIGPARDPFASAQAALDGVIASSMAAEALTAIRGDQLPLVMLDSDPAAGGVTVNLDIADGVRQVTEHLLGLGHRRFLHLGADVPSWTFEVRARELEARLRRVAGTSLRTARSPISIKGAEAAAEAALSGHRPTAVVCDDDQLAAGVYKAARRLGLRVPADLSVTGMDDLALATAIDPELTTVRLDAELFGERGMEALLAVLNGEKPSGTSIPVHLEVRGSTTRVP